MNNQFINDIKFNEQGLVSAIVQDVSTKEILMMAYMNKESLSLTLETGRATFFSRSRSSLWVKGEQSGNFLYVKEIRLDCDGDALLVLASPAGPSCHTGNRSCFFRTLNTDKWDTFSAEEQQNSKIIEEVYAVVKDRQINPKEGSYTNYLLEKGIDKILKKVGEESAEVIIGAKNNDKDEIRYEVADLIYHLTVMLVERGLTWEDVYKELEKRK